MHNYYGPTNTAKMAEINESAEIWASCFTDVSAIGVSRSYIEENHIASQSLKNPSFLYVPLKERREAAALASALVCCGCCNNALPMEWPEQQKQPGGLKVRRPGVGGLACVSCFHLVCTSAILCSHCILLSMVSYPNAPFSHDTNFLIRTQIAFTLT